MSLDDGSGIAPDCHSLVRVKTGRLSSVDGLLTLRGSTLAFQSRDKNGPTFEAVLGPGSIRWSGYGFELLAGGVSPRIYITSGAVWGDGVEIRATMQELKRRWTHALAPFSA